jgi:uncharacterized protein YbjT (DUF2867 family)
MSETVLVIGGTGQLGALVVRQLRGDGYRVRVLVRKLPTARDRNADRRDQKIGGHLLNRSPVQALDSTVPKSGAVTSFAVAGLAAAGERRLAITGRTAEVGTGCLAEA